MAKDKKFTLIEKIKGYRWAYKPFWYLRPRDDFEKGARCTICEKFIIRKDEHSLEAHELNHYE